MVNHQKRVTAVFAALADPTRRRIMERLSGRGETRVTTLARPFHVSLPAISRHLHVLERARLIERRRAGRLHLIRARSAGLAAAQKWFAQCAAVWDKRFDALDALLARGGQEEKRKDKRR